ncbi:MAG: RdgB/HAM1 family non-canonical purine NTP pyrophosphatase [Candidatus Hydrogenedentes bacterium]|nr:RdgB/HAM1 family non-canonical purine NTP pyrophosphatase [Candidatus Hydrogenedentota bacterium]
MAEVLLIGSGNRDKARELAELLHGLPWEVKCLKDLPAVAEPEEDGDTFEANALKKARFYGAHFDVACVADDSGLCVDALDGAPGVYSARYGGEHCSYEDNNRKLLKALAEMPWHERTAHFSCCAAFLPKDHDIPYLAKGVVAGHIAVAPSGNSGFGYDPLFVPDGEERSFAEMGPEEKHAISHRGRAFARIRSFLEL